MNNSSIYNSDLFAKAAETLLSGQFICEYAYEDQFELLSNEQSRAEMERLMRQMRRTLRQTNDQQAWYAAFSHIDNNERRAAIRSQFDTLINQMESLTRVLALVMSALHKDSTISPGDAIRRGEILAVIESTPACSAELDSLAMGATFRTSREGSSEKLNAIFHVLENDGYLVRPGGRGENVFIATGKWSYLYEVLEFIHTHEQLPSADDQIPAQQTVLL
jgi:biotin carboxyl carrier protein